MQWIEKQQKEEKDRAKKEYVEKLRDAQLLDLALIIQLFESFP